MNLSVAQYIPCSKANGPGNRAVLWVQGCDKRCPNCCNPQFQSFKYCNVENITILNKIQKDISVYNLRGITFSGGEPLHPRHINAIKELSQMIKNNTDLDILVFSGYSKNEIPEDIPVDMIIAGPYMEKLKHDKGIIASNNQEIIRITNKFDDIDDNKLFNSNRIIETFVDTKGQIILTGLVGANDLEL